jgi:hypothetical protein
MTLLFALLVAAPVKLGFATASGQVGTGVCSAKITVETEDAGGAPTPTPQPVPLQLSGPAAFFLTPDCSGDLIDPNGGATIAGNSAQVSFYFLHPKPVTLTITVQSTPYPLVTQSWTVVAAPGVVSGLAFVDSQASVQQGKCSPAFAYLLHDVNGAAAAAQRTIIVIFSPAGFVEFYSDSACANRVLSLELPVGSQGSQIYTRAAIAGAFPVQAFSPGLDPGSLSLQVPAASSGGCATAGGAFAALGILSLMRRRGSR